MTGKEGRSQSPEKQDRPNKARKTSANIESTRSRGRSQSPEKQPVPKKAKEVRHPNEPAQDEDDDEEDDLGPFARINGFSRWQKSESLPPPLHFMSSSPWVLPTKNNRPVNFDPNTIARNALETVVVMHPRLPSLVTSFLEYKRTYGSKLEKDLYRDMSQHDLVARLIKQRPLHFVQHHDYTVLRNGTSGVFRDEWLRVGTAEEHKNAHIFLEKYLSYDEQTLSSLLATSGPTLLINDGNPKNSAKIDRKTAHQDRGIFVGLVGARFAQPGHMDAACILPPIKTHKNGYFFRKQDPGLTKMFQDFFGGRPDGSEFNVPVYKGRMRISIETLLLEADDRAAQAGTTAYVQLVGPGLGVWRHAPVEEEQKQW